MSGKYQVLVVDDNRANRALQSLLLKGLGCLNYEARNLSGAYGKLMDDRNLDLIILDLTLEDEGDGIKFLRALKKSDYKHVPVLVTSGSGDELPQAKEAKDLADAYLTKPYDVEVYEETVRYLLTKDSMYNTFSKLYVGEEGEALLEV